MHSSEKGYQLSLGANLRFRKCSKLTIPGLSITLIKLADTYGYGSKDVGIYLGTAGRFVVEKK